MKSKSRLLHFIFVWSFGLESSSDFHQYDYQDSAFCHHRCTFSTLCVFVLQLRSALHVLVDNIIYACQVLDCITLQARRILGRKPSYRTWSLTFFLSQRGRSDNRPRKSSFDSFHQGSLLLFSPSHQALGMTIVARTFSVSRPIAQYRYRRCKSWTYSPLNSGRIHFCAGPAHSRNLINWLNLHVVLEAICIIVVMIVSLAP